MNRDQFGEMLKPLIERHPTHFGPEVHEEIFKLFQFLTLEEGCTVVSKLLFQSRYAPVESDFREVIKMIRAQKHEQRTDPYLKQDPNESIFSQEERNEMFQVLRDIVNRKVSKKDADQYAKMIRGLIRERSKKSCHDCEDGIIFAIRRNEPITNSYVFRCLCPLGMKRMETYPRWESRFQYSFVNTNEGPEAS